MDEKKILLAADKLLELAGDYDLSIEEIGAGFARFVRSVGMVEGEILEQRRMKKDLEGANKK